MLTVRQARDHILARATPLPGERVGIADAHHRILAVDAVAPVELPRWDNSAMDGFAVRAEDLPGSLPVAGTIAAGDVPQAPLAAGTAIRIMTGAPMPAGADTVVMREDVDDTGERASFAARPKPGAHIRRAGEDVKRGDSVVVAGTEIGAGEIGLLAALGFAEVDVYRRPRVAILSTGDELVDVDTAPGPGQIVNSNSYALAAQIRDAGGVPVPLGIARDEREALVERIREGLRADVLVTSGGVSVGDYDFVRDAFSDAGVDLTFWKVAMKPGKPLAFGTAEDGTLVFGLPGNPVSSMVSFELFVRPAMRALSGCAAPLPAEVPVLLAEAYAKKTGRAHFLRARLERTPAGLVGHLHSRQGSGMLRSMVGVDALVEIPADVADCPAGSQVKATLLKPV